MHDGARPGKDKDQKTSQWQLLAGFLFGFCFGFLLQKGGVTEYDVIIGQLLLSDWTVAKIILTAIATGCLGIYAMHSRGWVTFHRKPGSWGSTVPGGLLFGVGFGLLGYCPGTAVGAVAQGNLDALVGGVVGILIGVAIYVRLYPVLREEVLWRGSFGTRTLSDLHWRWKPFPTALVTCTLIFAILIALEVSGN